MQEEFNSRIENKTWGLSGTPLNRATLSSKWVFKLKRGPVREITRFKARWVVKGFKQEEGIDHNQTFASVIKPKQLETGRLNKWMYGPLFSMGTLKKKFRSSSQQDLLMPFFPTIVVCSKKLFMVKGMDSVFGIKLLPNF